MSTTSRQKRLLPVEPEGRGCIPPPLSHHECLSRVGVAPTCLSQPALKAWAAPVRLAHLCCMALPVVPPPTSPLRHRIVCTATASKLSNQSTAKGGLHKSHQANHGRASFLNLPALVEQPGWEGGTNTTQHNTHNAQRTTIQHHMFCNLQLLPELNSVSGPGTTLTSLLPKALRSRSELNGRIRLNQTRFFCSCPPFQRSLLPLDFSCLPFQ